MTPPNTLDNYTGVVFSEEYAAGYVDGMLVWYMQGFNFYAIGGQVDNSTGQ